jgi:hypothetical protein
VLQTLPINASSTEATRGSGIDSANEEDDTRSAAEPSETVTEQISNESRTSLPGALVVEKADSNSSISRLISVVEIIKAEYFRTLKANEQGLFQYNELGSTRASRLNDPSQLQ